MTTASSTAADHGPAAARRRKRSRPLHRVLLSPWTLGVGVALLVLAFVLPADGAGIPLCWVKAATGLPCPGCGLTRSVSSLAHLHFWDSLRYHPFGPLVLALGVFCAVMLLGGAKRRVRVARWLARRDRTARPVYYWLVGAFIAVGVVRWIVAVVDPSLVSHI